MKSMKFVMIVLILLFIGEYSNVSSANEIKRAWSSHDYNKVIELASQCAESDPDCAVKVAYSYYELKHYPEAIKYYEKYLSLGGDRKSILFNLGESYYKTGHYEKALETYKYILNTVPNDGAQAVALGYIISIYRKLKQFENAEIYAKRWIKVSPQYSNGYIELGAVYVDQDKYDEAIFTLKPYSDNDDAIVLLGKAYLGKKQYNDAISYYRKAIKLKPQDIYRYIDLAQIYSEMGNYSEAINTLKKASEIAPINPDVKFNLADTYLRIGQFEEALSILEQGIKIESFKGTGLENAIFQEGGYPVVRKVSEEAKAEVFENGPAKRVGIQFGDKIIKINDESTKNQDLGKIIQKLFSTPIGTKVKLTIERKGIDKPLEITIAREEFHLKGAAKFLAMRSLINAIKGNFDEARKDAEKAYALNPDDAWAKGAISFVYIIDTPPFTKEGKITEAIKILSGTKNSFDRLLEALAYSKMGDLKKSLDTYTSIPEDYLQTKNVFHQQFRNAVLESLKPYVDNKKAAAKSLEAKGQYRGALKEYEELIKIADEKETKNIRSHVATLIKARPDIAQLSEEARRHVIRAEASTKEGKFEDAVKEYKEAIKIAPFFSQLYKAIALNYEALKDYRQAIKNMNIYLDLYPDAPDTRAAKDQIYKWEYMMEKGGK
jgi:tetratricopeptide (TPR) repeat protein